MPLNEQLILGHAHRFASPIVATTPEEILQTRTQTLHQTRDLANGRNHRMVNHLCGFLHLVEGAVDEFVGTDDLQASAIDDVVHRGIEALNMAAHQRGSSLAVSLAAGVVGRLELLSLLVQSLTAPIYPFRGLVPRILGTAAHVIATFFRLVPNHLPSLAARARRVQHAHHGAYT